MLITALFFLGFTLDAMVHENAFGLVASVLLGAVVCARVLYFVVSC
jgi:hypothetical protein